MTLQGKILVTGGAGFIGSNIVEYILKHTTASVVVLDNLATGFVENVELFKDYGERYVFIQGDVSCLDDCNRACQGVDIICHQAALGSVPRSMKDPISSCNANIMGFITLLQCARQNGIRRFVYASSSSVYGDNTDPIKRVDAIGEPLSIYATTKLVNEKCSKIFSDAFGMELIGLRYFNVFGPRQSYHTGYPAVIPIFIHQATHGKDITILGDGSASRDFTHVTNVIQANLNAMTTTNSACFGRVFNIGCDTSHTILKLAKMIRGLVESSSSIVHLPPRVGDVPYSHADISLSTELLGYKPTTSLLEGVTSLLKLGKHLS